MEIKGRVLQVLPEEHGTSKAGKAWTKQLVILEGTGQYPKPAAILFFNATQIPVEGATITAQVEAESREYNGRWFTDLRCWKFIAEGGQVFNAPAPAQVEDDLPF